jgi:ribosomal protein S18 acetylase RimI-like enzyme
MSHIEKGRYGDELQRPFHFWTKREPMNNAKSKIKVTLPEIRHLESAAKIHGQVFSVIGHDERVALKILQTPDQRVAVAVERNGKVLGYTQASKRASTCYLSWIAVSKSARSKGVGHALLKNLRAWAKQNGCIEISLDSRNRFREALFFYLKSGFEIVGTYLGPDDDTMIRLRLKVRK